MGSIFTENGKTRKNNVAIKYMYYMNIYANLTYVRKRCSISPKSPYPKRGDSCVSQMALKRHAFPSIPNLNRKSSAAS